MIIYLPTFIIQKSYPSHFYPLKNIYFSTGEKMLVVIKQVKYNFCSLLLHFNSQI